MRKLFKNFNILGLVAFIAGGIFAISWTEVKKNDEVLWYQVEITDPQDPDTPSKQKIVGLYPGANPGDEPTGDCSNIGEILCAVQLDVSSSTFPTTMAEADADPGVEILETRHRD